MVSLPHFVIFLQCETMGLLPLPLPPPAGAPAPTTAELIKASLLKRKLVLPALQLATAVKSTEGEQPSSKRPRLDEEEAEGDEDKENTAVSTHDQQQHTSADEADSLATLAAPAEIEQGPKVIVEHQPLPSIYEVRQDEDEDELCADAPRPDDEEDEVEDVKKVQGKGKNCPHDDEEEGEERDQCDSGLSLSGDEREDEDNEDEESVDGSECDDEDEDEDDDDDDVDLELEPPVPSPLYTSVFGGKGAAASGPATPTPPKPLFGERFWSKPGSGGGNGGGGAGFVPVTHTPPPTPPPFAEPASPNHWIERAENGKSYLQLGSSQQQRSQLQNQTHHLPVVPVLQPKGAPPCPRVPPLPHPSVGYCGRGSPMPPLGPGSDGRPPCDHSNCLQRRSGLCYRVQRARMLNVSLHKLHMARQNHEGCLRRSVLICNMLRAIEDESEKDAAQDRYEQQQQQQQQQHHHHQRQQMELDPFWSPPPHVLPQLEAADGENTQSRPEVYHHHHALENSGHLSDDMASPATPSASPHPSSFDNDESLKGFDGEFRPTPFSSPVHHQEEENMCGGGDDASMVEASPVEEMEEDRGINWGSVLSLSSQSELDATFGGADTWSATSTTASSTTASADVEDIGWKLSADDVLRAFPPPGGGGGGDYIAA
jgi:hypothetical protein